MSIKFGIANFDSTELFLFWCEILCVQVIMHPSVDSKRGVSFAFFHS